MLALVNCDYQPRGNGLRTVTGDAALLQRILLKLTAHRGQFPFGEEFGSRLWTLSQLRPSERQAAAERRVRAPRLRRHPAAAPRHPKAPPRAETSS